MVFYLFLKKKKGKKTPQESVDNIIEFYCNDENSRLMSGKKDFVSIARRSHMQKRLILSNLKELNAKFKACYPDIKTCFSNFCSHRPKWCITVGASGTHTVCVCTYHQNVKLMVSAVELSKDYHELIDMLVCSRANKNCMIHRCPMCQEDSTLVHYLENELYSQDDIDEDDDYCIDYKQWKTTDRSELLSLTETTSSFVNILKSKLQKLTVHSYITKSQAASLRKLKNELSSTEVVVLLDFSENYELVEQDEIQSFHWNKIQATLHPTVIYYKENNVLKCGSLCFISDDLLHDVDMVYHVMKLAIEHIKSNISHQIETVHYFSDGCAGQYKNC